MADAVPLLSFKAGKVEYNETTHLATPKAGPGLIKVLRNADDPMFCSFVWEPRSTSGKTTSNVATETEREELLLFPGDAEWTHIKQCTTGRVFELKFKSSGQRHVFWMQTATDSTEVAALSEEDQTTATELKKLLEEETVEDEEMAEAESEDEPVGNRSAEPSTSTNTSTAGQFTADQVQAVLNSMRQSRQAQANAIPILNIADAVSQSQMVNYINSLPESQLGHLYRLIPENLPQSREELVRIVQSAQFAQGLGSLSSVLNQGGTGILVSSELEYPYSGEGVQGFLDGVRKQAESDKKNDDQHDEPN